MSTASSVASTTPANSGSRSRPCTAGHRRRRAARHPQPGREREEDLAAAVVRGRTRCGPAPARPGGPAAGSPRGRPARRSRPPRCTSPAGGGTGVVGGGSGSSRPTGTPSTVSRPCSPKFVMTSTPTVCPAAVTRRRRTDAALEAQAAHAGAGSDRAFRRRGRPVRDRAGRSAAATSSRSTCMRRASLRKLSSHSATTGMMTSSSPIARLLGDQQLAGRVVHPADLHRVGEEHRRLDQAPLLRGEEPGALAGAVEHRAARRHRLAEPVAARVDHGHAGAGHAPAVRRLRLVAPYRGVADPDAGDVDDRAGGAARQRPDPDSQLSGTRHFGSLTC